MFEYFVFIGAGVNLIGGSFYIRSVLKGDTKPNKATWLLWALIPMIAVFAALSDGVTWAVLPVFMSGFIPFLIFLSSFVNKNSYWKLGKLDYVCAFFSVLALVLWYITKNPQIAIAFAILADLFAGIPTIIKSIKHPKTESSAPFITGLVNSGSSFFAIKSWTFSSYGFPIYLLIMNTILIISISWPRSRK